MSDLPYPYTNWSILDEYVEDEGNLSEVVIDSGRGDMLGHMHSNRYPLTPISGAPDNNFTFSNPHEFDARHSSTFRDAQTAHTPHSNRLFSGDGHFVTDTNVGGNQGAFYGHGRHGIAPGLTAGESTPLWYQCSATSYNEPQHFIPNHNYAGTTQCRNASNPHTFGEPAPAHNFQHISMPQQSYPHVTHVTPCGFPSNGVEATQFPHSKKMTDCRHHYQPDISHQQQQVFMPGQSYPHVTHVTQCGFPSYGVQAAPFKHSDCGYLSQPNVHQQNLAMPVQSYPHVTPVTQCGNAAYGIPSVSFAPFETVTHCRTYNPQPIHIPPVTTQSCSHATSVTQCATAPSISTHSNLPSAHSNLPSTHSNPPSTHRVHRKLDSYNGDTDWAEYRELFECVASWNGWGLWERGEQLRMSLRGAALRVVHNMSHETKSSYSSLCTALQKRFAPPERTLVHRAAFRSRTKKPVETASEYGHELKYLGRRAFPTLGDVELEVLLLDQFSIGIVDERLQEFLVLNHVDNMDRAIAVATEWEALQGARIKATKPVLNTVQTNDNFDFKTFASDILDSLKKVNSRIDEMKSSDNTKQCYYCRQTGHIQRFCPNKPNTQTTTNTSKSLN